MLATWLLAYAVLRTVVELFRGDVERGVYRGLGVGQWTSLVIFAVGVAVWVTAPRKTRPRLRRRGRARSAGVDLRPRAAARLARVALPAPEAV